MDMNKSEIMKSSDVWVKSSTEDNAKQALKRFRSVIILNWMRITCDQRRKGQNKTKNDKRNIGGNRHV